MKVTMYEFLGMLKEGNRPEKIKFDDIIFEDDGMFYDGMFDDEITTLDDYVNLTKCLNDTVEIIEEKEIPISLNILGEMNVPSIFFKVNEIIDYLDYLKSKGETK